MQSPNFLMLLRCEEGSPLFLLLCQSLSMMDVEIPQGCKRNETMYWAGKKTIPV